MSEPLVDESESTINQITLDCLLNRTQYEKYVSKKLLNQISRKDQLFYRKRALNLTKELLKGDEDLFVSPDVKYAFECYIKTCVRYFRVLDKSDLIQEEYKSLNLTSQLSEEEMKQSLDGLTELDEILMRKINLKHNGTLDNFVEIKTLVQEDMVVIPPPQQRRINLKDPILRNKGIRKKKNIENKYNEKQKVEEKVQEVIKTLIDEEDK
jgi:hypothetical protein